MAIDAREKRIFLYEKKGADQPVHLQSLISTFLALPLEIIMAKLPSNKITASIREKKLCCMQKCRPACASTQSDQHLCCSPSGNYNS